MGLMQTLRQVRGPGPPSGLELDPELVLRPGTGLVLALRSDLGLDLDLQLVLTPGLASWPASEPGPGWKLASEAVKPDSVLGLGPDLKPDPVLGLVLDLVQGWVLA